ncbi:MAG TPA: cadherin domain-containing protein, partial [Microbacterium sp.]|nr:cadherin domain-containing protein [Microbacterium sp.]
MAGAALTLATGAFSTALASHPVASLDFACAAKAGGAMRYVTDVSQCNTSTEVAISIRPGPTVICLQPDGTARPQAPRPALPNTAMPAPSGFRAPPRVLFDIPLVTPGQCASTQTVLTLPSATDAYFCAATSSGRLRYVTGPTKCTASETTLVAANHAPGDVALSNASVAENQPAGTTVGTLSATDPDRAESFTFALVSGAGDADNAAFQVDGATLETNVVFDAETTLLNTAASGLTLAGSGYHFAPSVFAVQGTGSYSVRVRVTDAVGATREESFTITVTDANDAPTDITLTPSSIVENSPAGSTVGTLAAVDQDSGQTHAFALVAGLGDTDNASFTIAGTQLQTAASLPIGSYTVRVQTDDGAGGTFARALTVTVTDVNDAPTDIELSNATVAENQPPGAPVGMLSATDADLPAQTFTFTLPAAGCGGGPIGDNASFAIVGAELRTAASLDVETKASYSICVRVTDSGAPAQSFDEPFTITVIGVNDPPAFALIAAPDQTVLEDAGPQTVTGFATAISAGGESGQTLTFSVVAADPGLFSIQPDIDETTGDLTYTPAPDANGPTTVTVTLSDDGGGTDTSPAQVFDITITPVNDEPSFTLTASPDQTVPQDAGP